MATKHELSAASLIKLISFLFWNWIYFSVVENAPGKSPEWCSRLVTLLHGTVATLGGLTQCKWQSLTPWHLTNPELEEAAGALLERCADVNRFLRADAANALVKVACGGSEVRAVVALSRRGAAHRAAPVRAAAAAALAQLVQVRGAHHVLALPPDTRTLLLRAAGDLLADANGDTRQHARKLCLALGEDVRFRQMLKEAIPPSRYRAIEKYVDKLRYR